MDRKILLVFIFIIFGFSAFLLGYFFIDPKNTAIQTGSLIDRFGTYENKNIVDGSSGSLPVSSRKLSTFIVSPSNSQKIVAADKSGVIVEISIQDLRETVVANLKSKEPTSILLAPSGNSIFYSSYNNGGKKYFYLNLREGEPVEIDKNIKSSVFSSHDDQLLYLSGSDGEEALYVLKNRIIKKLLNTRLSNAILGWPSDLISIASYDKYNYGDLFVLDGESQLNKIVSYQKDLAIKWSPSAQKLLFSTKDGQNSPRLYYQDFGKDERVDLGVPVDVSRCAWLTDEASVICGITDHQSNFKDEFYQISVVDKSIVAVTTPSIDLVTKEIALDRSEDTVFVLNEIDSKLYALKIK